MDKDLLYELIDTIIDKGKNKAQKVRGVLKSMVDEMDEATTNIPITVDFAFDDESNNPLANKIISEFRELVLSRIAIPPVYVMPSSSINLDDQLLQVGSNLSVVFNQLFTPADSGGKILNQEEILKNGAVIQTGSSSFAENIVVPEGSVKYGGRVYYSQGPVKNDDLGNPSPDGRILAGNTISPVKTIQGIYPVFYKVYSSQPSPQLLADDIEAGNGVSVLLVDGNTEFEIIFNATNQFLAFGVFEDYNVKNGWFISTLNSGTIGNVDDLFPDTNQVINIESPDGFWTNKNFRMYLSGYKTTTDNGQAIKFLN